MGLKIKPGEFDPEASDGCTAIAPIFKFFTKEKHMPFKDCCVEHDKFYWYGGDPKIRNKADKDMRECVSKRGYPILAWIMWAFVHFLSGPKLFWIFDNPFPWSWEEKVIILGRDEDE